MYTEQVSSNIEDCKVIYSYRGDELRHNIETFISKNFHKSYKAKITRFAEIIIACKDYDDKYITTLGISRLDDKKKSFVESYLPRSIEDEIAWLVKKPILRSQIFEISNLSTAQKGMAREVIKRSVPILNSLGAKWVFFSATKEVFNTFLKVGLKPIFLADALEEKIMSFKPHADWGKYYSTTPKVYCLEVPSQ